MPANPPELPNADRNLIFIVRVQLHCVCPCFRAFYRVLLALMTRKPGVGEATVPGASEAADGEAGRIHDYEIACIPSREFADGEDSPRALVEGDLGPNPESAPYFQPAPRPSPAELSGPSTKSQPS